VSQSKTDYLQYQNKEVAGGRQDYQSNNYRFWIIVLSLLA
jgi:hypothetical protein